MDRPHNKRFIVSSRVGSVVTRAFYQKALTDTEIGILVRTLEHAHAWRRFDIIEPLSAVLSRLTVDDKLQSIGGYFGGLVRLHCGELAEAYVLLEQAASKAGGPFASRAVLSIAAVAALSGDTQSQMQSYAKLLRSDDPFTLLHSHKMIAVRRAQDGDHAGSLALLENMLPFAQRQAAAHPNAYLHFMHSLAVELVREERLPEAVRVSQVLASPLASLYPECRETRTEILEKRQRASRRLIAVSKYDVGSNVLWFRPGSSFPACTDQPGKLINLETKVKKSPSIDFESLTEQEKRLTIVAEILQQAPGANLAELFSAIPTEEQSLILVDAAITHASKDTLNKMHAALQGRSKKETK